MAWRCRQTSGPQKGAPSGRRPRISVYPTLPVLGCLRRGTACRAPTIPTNTQTLEVQRSMTAMPEGIITMQDMNVIFSVTDSLGIHRESVSVELTKEDPGVINKSSVGKIEITVPESSPIEEFAQRLQAELEAMGYIPADGDEEDE